MQGVDPLWHLAVPNLPKDPEERWREQATRFLRTAIALEDQAVTACAAGGAPPAPQATGPLPPPSQQGTSLSGLYTGLAAVRAGDVDAARALSCFPLQLGPVAATCRPALALEGEGYEDVRVELGEVCRLSDEGDEAGARRALAAFSTREILYLPPSLKRTIGRAAASARLAEIARLALDGKVADAHGVLVHTQLLGQHEPWMIEALLALAWLAVEQGEPLREAREAVLGLLQHRIDNASLEEELYHRFHRVLERAARTPREAGRAFRSGLARPVRDPRQIERLALCAVARWSDDAFAQHMLGATLWFEGDPETAERHLGRALSAGREQARLLYALSLIATGREQPGLEALAPLVDAERPPREALLALARSAAARGKREEALALLDPVLQAGEPYGSQARVVQADILMDQGALDEAYEALHGARDACDQAAVRAFRRLDALLAKTPASALAEGARERIDSGAHAAEMAALPPIRQTYAFITNPAGHPAVLAIDPGGMLFLGVHRATGRQVLWRLRKVAPGEKPQPPATPQTPAVLEVLAQDSYLGRRHTVFLYPGGAPLTRVLAREPREIEAVRRPLLVTLAAAIADLAMREQCVGWLLPERVLVGAEGAPALLPFDPWDDPRNVPEGQSPSAALAPELLRQGAAAASPASDVYAFAHIARSFYLDGEALAPGLERALVAGLAAAPADRPRPLDLLRVVIDEAH